ncbi:Endo-1,4-beta-xylanase D [Lachnellula suecica]|uniref:Beta-xylanase n=1 Tax=Lachnellula suecica TaxID=602035 RepID=A0A8T9C285_9HELO|nr:Endo-1,4-beta-xylanase D [Lachnellula suecica]
MRFQLPLIAAIAAVPLASAQLNELAKKAGKLYFGTATDNMELNGTYLKILDDTKEFGQLTPANGMKWFAVEPEQGVFNYSDGSVVANLATKNKQKLRCHNLVWHSQLAPWVDATTWTKKTLTAALINHVTHEARHWAGQCYAWDVLNEALNDDGTYRNDTFLSVLGPDYIKIAFRAAAAADPHAKLYYNDYNIESPGNKSTSVRENIVKFLQDDGIRIDGVGLQSHFVTGSSPTIDQQIATMQSYADMNLDVAITELDVRNLLPSTATVLAQQSKDYANAVGACMQVDRCVGITVWDFYDPYSWVPGVFTGYGDADLWFSNFTKHPAYYGVVGALKNSTGKHHHGRAELSWEA